MGSVLKSVAVGLVSTVFLIVLGWSLFASSEELNDRRPISVLIDPDFRILPATNAEWVETGKCVKSSISRPVDGPAHPFLESIVCRNWQLTNGYQGLVNNWTATEFTHRSARRELEIGSSRLDAASDVLNRFGSFGEKLLVPIGVFVAINFGVSIGIWFRKREAKTFGSNNDA